uniref:Uncharacterized protein n=1 Tax=Arundo donax TaxID=35708 RepID=A0A0A8YPW9_ARUDO
MALNAIFGPAIIHKWLSSSYLQHPQAAGYTPSITMFRLRQFIDAHTTAYD